LVLQAIANATFTLARLKPVFPGTLLRNGERSEVNVIVTSQPITGALDEHDNEDLPSCDRRKSTRFALLFRAAKLVADGREYLCVVRDASTEGLKIRYFGQFPDSANLRIELSNGDIFPVELVWNEGSYAGLRFAEVVEVSRIVALGDGDLPKRNFRLRTDIAAELICDQIPYPVTVRNLSQQGAGIECEERFAQNRLVRLEIDGLPQLYAKVRWHCGNDCGLVFETTLSFEALADAVLKPNS
jgi:hypothetical protein